MPRIPKTKVIRPQISSRDIYTYIANTTSLTKVQVKECFDAYHNMLFELSMSDFVDKGLKIPLPHIGNFQFFKKNGFKKGSTYTNIGYNCERAEKEERLVREKDTQPYYLIRLKLFPKFTKTIKEKTRFFEN